MAFMIWFFALMGVVGVLAWAGIQLYFALSTRAVEEEKLHKDAGVVADMSREILGFPSGIEVKSRLIHLQHFSRAEVFMSDILMQRDENWQSVMQRMIGRFERVDDELYALLQLSRRHNDEATHSSLSRLIEAHEAKLRVLNYRLQRLFEEKRQENFVNGFFELNENLLSYRDQIKMQANEIRRMLRPDAPQAADFIREALASEV